MGERNKIKLDCSIFTKYPVSLLNVAALNGQDDVVSHLVKKHGAKVDYNADLRSDPVYFPLCAAVAGKHLSTAKLLMGLGAGKKKKYTVPKFQKLTSYSKHIG